MGGSDLSYPFLSRGLWGRPQSRHTKRAPFTPNQLFRALGGRRAGPSIGDRIIFDALEPRLLMNADVLGINLASPHDDGISHDMIVRLVEENQQIDARTVTTQRVEIRDRSGNALLAFGDLAEISAISIQGGTGDDTL
ncbi:MAG: LEPR-XLL domain-containing protein, partial [Alphaproteobacteria bacterium]